MVSAIGPSGVDWSTPTFGPSGIDWSNGSSPLQDLNDYFDTATSGIRDTLSSATTNQLNGLVNNAADAAAKRLGVPISSSSNSSASSSSQSASKTTTKTSTGGQNIASANIDQLLARLDGNPPAAATSAAQSGTSFNLDSYLGGLDKIAAGKAVGKSTTPTGKNFSIDSYLQTIDAITPHSPSIVNVTT
jgi:hypothetical protein